jgi:hypothetical protein
MSICKLLPLQLNEKCSESEKMNSDFSSTSSIMVVVYPEQQCINVWISEEGKFLFNWFLLNIQLIYFISFTCCTWPDFGNKTELNDASLLTFKEDNTKFPRSSRFRAVILIVIWNFQFNFMIQLNYFDWSLYVTNECFWKEKKWLPVVWTSDLSEPLFLRYVGRYLTLRGRTLLR